MRETTTRGCDSCEMLSINGVACHETGCRNTPRRCPECGLYFAPDAEGRDGLYCSHSCAVVHTGAWCDCDECDPVS